MPEARLLNYKAAPLQHPREADEGSHREMTGPAAEPAGPGRAEGVDFNIPTVWNVPDLIWHSTATPEWTQHNQ